MPLPRRDSAFRTRSLFDDYAMVGWNLWTSIRSYCFGIWVLVLQALIRRGDSTLRKASASTWQRFIAKISTRKAPKGLPSVSPMEQISERACRVIGFNPGAHTLQGTNTYLIGVSASKILIDTGEDIASDRYVTFLFDTAFPLTSTESLYAILLTHGHFDHIGGVMAILRECSRRGLPTPIVYKHKAPHEKYGINEFQCFDISDGQTFKADDSTTLQAIYSPGHTDDHVAFVLEV